MGRRRGVTTGKLEGKFTQRGDWIQPDTLFQQPETNDLWMRPLTYCCDLPRFRVNWGTTEGCSI